MKRISTYIVTLVLVLFVEVVAARTACECEDQSNYIS